IALVLLVSAGLLFKSLNLLLKVPLGFESHGRLTMKLFLSPSRFKEGGPQGALYLNQVLERLKTVPGVKSAAIVDSLPLRGGASTDLEIAGRPVPRPGEEPAADIRMVSLAYFQTMGIPLLEGRWFTHQDTADSPRVMIISQ